MAPLGGSRWPWHDRRVHERKILDTSLVLDSPRWDARRASQKQVDVGSYVTLQFARKFT